MHIKGQNSHQQNKSIIEDDAKGNLSAEEVLPTASFGS